MPRCATCPVVLAARARAAHRLETRAALVEEMLIGRPPRPLPEPVQTALEQIVAARRVPAPALPPELARVAAR